MNQLKKILAFLCIILSSCRTVYELPCSISRVEFLSKDSQRLFGVDPSGLYKDLKDVARDSIIGGYYTFYQNGMLKEYAFFRDTNLVNYREQFDSTGILKYQYAEPLVYKEARVWGDSASLSFYLFSLSKSFSSITVFRNGHDSLVLKTLEDSLFTNMKVVRYKANIAGRTHENGILKVSYVNRCTGEERFFSDTFSLSIEGIGNGISR